MRKNPALLVLMAIMLINALSYGTIIPLLYPYASRFGINPLGLSLLFASFSLAQLVATPIIGRLSDKYGRKPLLLLCLGGTSLSLALFASAQSLAMLFVARILDGITGGNISVAQAVIADSTEGHERAAAFGLLGAAFGFGFLFGPALGGLLSTISLSAPFWFSSFLALAGTVAGTFFLRETLKKSSRQPSREPYFDINKIKNALTHSSTSNIFIATFIFTTALNCWIIGFQAFSNDVLTLSARDIGLLYASFGLISVIMQAVGIRLLLARFHNKPKILLISLVLSVAFILPLFFVHSFVPFFVILLFYAIVSSPIGPILSSLISERTKAEDQGGILGVNQSITSLGQIGGPIIGGISAGVSANFAFLASGAIMTGSLIFAKKIVHTSAPKADL